MLLKKPRLRADYFQALPEWGGGGGRIRSILTHTKKIKKREIMAFSTKNLAFGGTQNDSGGPTLRGKGPKASTHSNPPSLPTFKRSRIGSWFGVNGVSGGWGVVEGTAAFSTTQLSGPTTGRGWRGSEPYPLSQAMAGHYIWYSVGTRPLSEKNRGGGSSFVTGTHPPPPRPATPNQNRIGFSRDLASARGGGASSHAAKTGKYIGGCD